MYNIGETIHNKLGVVVYNNLVVVVVYPLP